MAEEAKCPFLHIAGEGTTNQGWWPRRLNLEILQQSAFTVGPLASLIHDARFRARSGHLLRLAVLRGRPASLAFVSPHSD